MLTRLQVTNYALIRSLDINPTKGLNTVTGETGAGKSVLLGAVGLLLGNRADTKSLYEPDKTCVIEGTFDLSNYPHIKNLFEALDIDYDNECIIRRQINAQGKSRAFVNDTPAQVSILKQLGPYLIDIHSQHDNLLLGNEDFRLQITDAFAGNSDLLRETAKKHTNFKQAESAWRNLAKSAAELKKEADFNLFLLNELNEAGLDQFNPKEAEEKLKQIEHTEQIKTALNRAFAFLEEPEYGILAGLQNIKAEVNPLTEYSEAYRSINERFKSCLIELQDLADGLQHLEAEAEFDPREAELLRNRLDKLYTLQKKHHTDSVEKLTEIHAELAEKINKTENVEAELKLAEQQLARCLTELETAAQRLSEARKKALPFLEQKITELAADIAMPNAVLKAVMTKKELSAEGFDNIEFLFSANKGIAPRPLKEVASGGEFSRLMLCFKTILADKTTLPTVIFDEIDTGISGETALKVGKMMLKTAERRQVITVTHLPQIAALGQTHFNVFKHENTGRTETVIRKLNQEERIPEIAKMIGGQKPSEVTKKSAEELLKLSV